MSRYFRTLKHNQIIASVIFELYFTINTKLTFKSINLYVAQFVFIIQVNINKQRLLSENILKHLAKVSRLRFLMIFVTF